jgi:hypothetical protein
MEAGRGKRRRRGAGPSTKSNISGTCRKTAALGTRGGGHALVYQSRSRTRTHKHEELTMSDDLQTISTIATSVSAVAAAAAAIANWRNTSTFVRQLRNTTVDASLTAAFAFQAAVHKTIEFRENQMKGVDNITPEKTLAAYGDAWPRWEAFHQAYRIAQRYRKDLSPGLKDLKSPPDRACDLLSELRLSLRDDSWTPGGDNDPKDIRKAVDKIVDEIEAKAGLAEGTKSPHL